MMNLLLILVIFLLLLAGSLLALRVGGLNGIYIYVAGTTATLYLMNFMQVSVFGQILFMAELFIGANFLITDVVEEHYGKKEARKVIPIALAIYVFIWLITFIGTKLSPAEFDVFHGPLSEIVSFYTPLTMGLIVVVYTLLVFIDTHIYDKIRQWTKGKYLWMRNVGSTLVTQTVDTLVSYCIFLLILFPEMGWPEILSAMISAAIFKYSMAFLDTPFVYLSYWFKPSKEVL